LQLAVTLKEVKYLRDSLGIEDIPAVAAKLYEENDTLNLCTEKLTAAANKYNKVRKSRRAQNRTIHHLQ
jgi:hypothetical protein